jgi:uncharacterized protein YjiS (DUF1127 family)
MSTPMHLPTVTASSQSLPPAVFSDAMNALHAFARTLDSWLAQRQRTAQDLDALASMSDRELRDIGMNRASTNFVALGGRIRDYPF